ncbi:MAG: hypothetical protein JSW73_00925 [Candidatus Woesearchaeota archaeon]|nr:MAG: hypothetical protein JSW73_00925 [Candidatus Woesearchaeota archaeon]
MLFTNKEKVCKAIYDCNPVNMNGVEKPAFEYGKFIFTSGKIQIFKINHRVITSDPKKRRDIVDELTYVARDWNADHIVSSESAGIPWGTLVAYELGVGSSVIRQNGELMGVIPKDVERICGVDDLNTTYRTLLCVVKGVKSLGADIKNYTVIVDREEYTPENEAEFKKLGIKLIPLVTGAELIDYGLEKGLVRKDKIELIEQYKKDSDAVVLKIIKENPEWVLNHKRLDRTYEFYKNNDKIKKALEELIESDNSKEKTH